MTQLRLLLSLAAALLAGRATAAELPVISSWIGNTWDGVRHPQMPLTADDLGVSGDGVVTLSTHYNEGGHCMLVLRDGRSLGLGMHATETAHTAGSPDGPGLFVAVKGEYGRGVSRFTHFGDLHDPSLSQTRFGPLDKRDIAGLAWRGGYLYAAEASDKGFNGVRVFEAARWAAGQEPAHTIDLTGKPKVGRVAVDSRGDPWVIQGNDVVRYALRTGKEAARVTLPPPAVPAALAVDHLDRVLVADRGPDCDIKVFDEAGRPAGAVGARGGFAAGPVPGLIGPLRFDKPAGLGVDAARNLYVYSAGGNWPQAVRVESYGWDGKTWSKPGWKAEGLIGGDSVFLDPQDETRGYNSGSQFRLDWSRPPGKEWAFHATTLDTFDAAGGRTADPRCNLGVWWGSHGVRRIHGRRFLFAAAACDLAVYRFSKEKNELAIPSVFLAARSPHHGEGAPPGWPAHEPRLPDNSSWIWTDTNGDGKFDKGEYKVLSHMSHSQVADDGTIFFFPTDFKREPNLRVWPVAPALDAAGNPVYDPKAILDYPAPAGWDRPRYLAMDRASGDLVVAGFRDGSGDVTLCYYAGWCKDLKMKPTWIVEHLGPETRTEDSGYDTTGDHVATVQLHGPYVFVPSVLSNHVRVYRRKDGSPVGTLRHTLSPNTTLDGYYEFGVHRRGCGEYILTGECFLQNKSLVYRWMPEGPNLRFERPALAEGSERANPADAAWTFEGASGLFAAGSPAAGRVGAAEGRQGAFLRKGGWFYQALPLERGGRCVVSSRISGDAAQRVEVRLDDRVVGTFTPGPDRYVECLTTPEAVEEGGHVVKFAALGEGTALVGDVRVTFVPPAPPAEVAAVAEDGRVTLSWVPSPGAKGYNIYRTEVAVARFECISTNLPSTAFADDKVQPGRTYRYRVAAFDGAGESVPARVVGATVPNPKDPPSAFDGGPLAVSASGANREVRLWWRPVEGATGYTVWRGGPGGPTAVVAEGVKGPPYVDAAVTAGAEYSYRVAATKAGAASRLSFPAAATPVDNPNLGFEVPALPAKGRVERPAGAGWKFEGRAGVVAFDNQLVAAYRPLEGRQAAWLAGAGVLSQDVVFAGGRHYLRLQTMQIHGGEGFRVRIDGRQVGVFEPCRNPTWVTTGVFATPAGRHTVTLEGVEPPKSPGSGEEPTCLIDAVTVRDADE